VAEKQDEYAELNPFQRPGRDPKFERPLAMKRTMKAMHRKILDEAEEAEEAEAEGGVKKKNS
jgi:hypothetical protein